MGKAGKPNSFLKGMQMDMDPLLQPKDSYRYAKNIRLSSYVGKNISIQPYDSDRLALSLSSGDIGAFTTPSISDIVNWPNINSQQYDNWSQLTWKSFFTYLEELTTGGIDLEDYFTSGTLSDNYTGTSSGGTSYNSFYGLVSWYMDLSQDQEEGDGNVLPAFIEGGFWSTWHSNFLVNDSGEDRMLPVTTSLSGVGDANSDGIGLSFQATLTYSDDEVETITTNVPPFSEISDATTNPLYFETMIANSITLADNGIICNVAYSAGTGVTWTFSSSTEVQVTNIDISATSVCSALTSLKLYSALV